LRLAHTDSDKGKILNTLSVFWFARTGHIIDNHLILHRVADYPQPFNSLNDELEGRSMLVRRAQIIPVECVVRGYLAGSGVAGIPEVAERVRHSAAQGFA
jgi:phosphoribosylaminoimidazole-succinocarboxamide synthase